VYGVDWVAGMAAHGTPRAPERVAPFRVPDGWEAGRP
jgi:hypothetical protein